MHKESQYLLKTLKSFIHNENPGTFSGDWKKLIQLSQVHSVTSILGYMVMNYPQETAGVYGEALRKHCLESIGLYSQKAECMKALIEQMNQKGIEHLLFKGFVLREYYPVPELRTFGDIDFLIQQDDRKRCDALMMELGFQRETDWEPVYSYRKGVEHYEIHTDVMEVDVSDRADYQKYFSHTWERAKLKEGQTYVFSPEDHLIYVLTHIAKHINGSGAGIRMYLDVAVFLKYFEGKLNVEYLQQELEKLAFKDFSNMVFTLVEKVFEVKSPLSLWNIPEDIFQDFLEFTMKGGTFGKVGRDAGLISLKQTTQEGEEVSRGKTLRKRLFPSAGSIESRYTYLRGKHWLLPIAWVHRFFKTRDTWGEHSREAKSIMKTDKEKVERLQRIYKEIGL
ncbi:MAG: nucleotidyltransferase family protein [Eubacterium sp.]|nr:nucleotidyltransferase family protein [Eubacterium sp.]